MIPPTRLKFSLLLSLLVCLSGYLDVRKARANETPFPLLPGLEGSVNFWKKIFTHYSRSEVVFYNEFDPNTIYKVVDVGKRRNVRWIMRRERRKISRAYGVDSKSNVSAQRGAKERFAAGLERSGKYLKQMQQIFREEGLPIGLTYLPLIESSFNIRARSRAGAVGLWQFIRSTGRKFLRIRGAVDERKDPLESTRAASRLLKENYAVLGNWPLAITAYNHGREGIIQAMSQVGSDDLVEIIRNYRSRSFGYASKNFYAEFVAAVEVAKNADEYFPNLEYHPPSPMEEIEAKRSISISSLLKPTGVPRSKFLEWNPALSRRIRYVPRGYRIKVPPEKQETFVDAYHQAALIAPNGRRLSSCKKNASWSCYRVLPGETISQIARRHRVSVRKILKINDLSNPHFIIAGRYLKIPKR